MRVAVIGTGYVGLVTGVVLADLGNQVLCIENDPEKLAKLRAAEAPSFEPGIEELLKRTIADGSLRVSDSVAEAAKFADVLFIAVGTPSRPDGSVDLSAVHAVAEEIGKNLTHDLLVVNKSTAPVGTVREIGRIIERSSIGRKAVVASNPEFLREGNALQDTREPDRIVIGADDRASVAALEELYSPLNKPILFTSPESAEMIKYACNAFLATKISYINAISRVCELCGADVAHVAKGMGMDRRIGPDFLKAGLGYGGSCLPKDVAGFIDFAGRMGYDFQMLHAVKGVNEAQASHFLQRIEKELGGLEGKTICVLGLAFKPETDDMRAAKSLEVIDFLLARGAAVRVHDPAAMHVVEPQYPQIEFAESPYCAAEGADAAILVTEWNAYKNMDFDRFGAKMCSKVFFDGRRACSQQALERAGFRYFTIGS